MHIHFHGWYFSPILLCVHHTAFFSTSLHIFIQTGLLNKISRAFPHFSLFFTNAYLFVLSFCPLLQSVMLLSSPVPMHTSCQLFSSHRFCNNHTNKPIILIATCTMIYSSFMMSTQRIISSFRPLLNDTQINAVISINDLLLNT